MCRSRARLSCPSRPRPSRAPTGAGLNSAAPARHRRVSAAAGLCARGRCCARAARARGGAHLSGRHLRGLRRAAAKAPQGAGGTPAPAAAARRSKRPSLARRPAASWCKVVLVRLRAALGPGLQEVVPLLTAGLRDGERRVRGAAAFALGMAAEFLQPAILGHYREASRGLCGGRGVGRREEGCWGRAAGGGEEIRERAADGRLARQGEAGRGGRPQRPARSNGGGLRRGRSAAPARSSRRPAPPLPARCCRCSSRCCSRPTATRACASAPATRWTPSARRWRCGCAAWPGTAWYGLAAASPSRARTAGAGTRAAGLVGCSALFASAAHGLRDVLLLRPACLCRGGAGRADPALPARPGGGPQRRDCAHPARRAGGTARRHSLTPRHTVAHHLTRHPRRGRSW
jgi:hypothetical protein